MQETVTSGVKRKREDKDDEEEDEERYTLPAAIHETCDTKLSYVIDTMAEKQIVVI